jgi:hypothetical protein
LDASNNLITAECAVNTPLNHRMRKSHHHLLKELPKTVEHSLHLYDPTVAAFVRTLASTEDHLIYGIIDEMFFHYTKKIKHMEDMLVEYYEFGTPEDVKKLKDYYMKQYQKVTCNPHEEHCSHVQQENSSTPESSSQ